MADGEPAPTSEFPSREHGTTSLNPRAEPLLPPRTAEDAAVPSPAVPTPAPRDEEPKEKPVRPASEPKEPKEAKKEEPKAAPKEVAPVAPAESETPALPISVQRLIPKLKKSAKLFEEGK